MARNEVRAIAGRWGRTAAGFTLVELMVALLVLLLAVLACLFGLGASVRDVSSTKQAYVALTAAAGKVEEMKGKVFEDLYTLYGPGSAGQSFPVTYEEDGRTYTLKPSAGGNAGSVELCVNETAIPAGLGWVGAYDLNGDGDATDADVKADYKILPVIVRVVWRDAEGQRREEIKTVLFNLQ